MTIGQFVEAIVGKAAAIYGGFADCSAFNNKGSKVTRFGEMLSQMGYHSSGNDVLYNGMTGEQIETEVFIGPTYYMRLKHMVKDKINYRALGPRTALTRQPVEGRANDGGLRIGEMERDAIISHGAANFLTESMMERGDKYFMAVCNKTGMIAIYNPANNLFMSPMADGPIRYVGSLAGDNLQIQNVTKYGRSFSVVSIPYTMKLLIHELQTINIQMRVITEDNIDQIENMSYSKNIEKLVQIEGTGPLDIIPMIRKTLGKTAVVKEPDLSESDKREESPESSHVVIQSRENSPPLSPHTPEGSPTFSPHTPEGSPTSSPHTPDGLFNPNTPDGSPLFNPNTPDGSPRYASDSPPYASDSPPFAPVYSPDSEYSGGNTESYKIGDRVMIRGGTGTPNDHWTVSNITPDFITIENQDPNTIEDPIRVVEPNQIAPYQPIMYSQQPVSQDPILYPANYSGYEKYPPNINVAPIIKIVNGNDNSTGPLSEEEPKSSQASSDPPFVIKKNNNSETSREGETIGGGVPNEIDFTKPMMIVKKE